MGDPGAVPLRDRMLALLHEHHTATVATVGPLDGLNSGSAPDASADAPHAATVFYAADDRFRLVFLSKGSSTHGSHIRAGSRVAVTVAGSFDDWRQIRGLQLWGTAEVLRGAARAAALLQYMRRFPFVRDLLTDARMARQLREIEVFRVTPERVSLTDNTMGLFGREVIDDLQGTGDPHGVGGHAQGAGGGRTHGDRGSDGASTLVRGVLVSGRQEAGAFLGVPWVQRQVSELLGADPFPGTLNLRVRDEEGLAAWREQARSGACLTLSPTDPGYCAASYFPVLLNGEVEGGVILPHVAGYPEDMLEVVAAEGLRDRFGVADGDVLTVEWMT